MCDFNVVSALTFSFSGITLIVLLRNFAFSKPTIKVYDHGGDSTRPYQSLIIEIAKPDDAKFSLHRISICSPKETLISKVPNEGSEPSWGRSVEVQHGRTFEKLWIKDARGCVVKTSVIVAFNSDTRFKRRCTTNNKMAD